MKPDGQQWEEWTASPAGQWFFGEFLPAEARRTFDAYVLSAWDRAPDAAELAKMRERAEVLQWLARACLSDFTAAQEAQQQTAQIFKGLLGNAGK